MAAQLARLTEQVNRLTWLLADHQQLMTIEEAADFLRLEPRQVKRMIADKEIPHIRLSRTEIRLDRAELSQWLNDSHRVASDDEIRQRALEYCVTHQRL